MSTAPYLLSGAAGVRCSGALPPDEARWAAGLRSRHEAEGAFIDASRDFPDDLWRCAPTGSGCTNMAQNKARVMVPLPREAFAPVEVARCRKPPVAEPSDTAPAKPSSGIEVGGSQRGSGAIDLRPPAPSPRLHFRAAAAAFHLWEGLP